MIGELIETKACLYILPMLGEDRSFYGYTEDLMNVYMFEESYPGIDGHIYLLYKDSEGLSASSRCTKITQHEHFVGSYTIYSENRYTMSVFQLPDNLSFEVKVFWNGKYSEFSEYYKMMVLGFHEAIPNSILHGILGKEDKTKKHLEKDLSSRASSVTIPNGMDLDSKPIITTETFFFKDLVKFEKS